MPEMEERARNMGWLPQEEFRGNPDNWVPAEKFVGLAETSLPHLKGTLKTMERKMAEQDALLRRQTEEMTGLRQDLSEFVQFSKGAEQRAYDKAVRDLKTEQLKAKEAGDLPAFVEATDKLDNLISEHPAVTGKPKVDQPGAAPASTPKTPDEEYRAWMAAEPAAFDDWKAEQKWFTEEPEMFAYAQQMDQFLQANHGFTMKRSERLAKLTELVKKKFPEYFGNPARKKGSPVEGDTGGGPSGNGRHTYNDLPPEAKKQCDKWTGKDGKGESGTIPKYTREQYLKDYKW
jgi:hypothetical protein